MALEARKALVLFKHLPLPRSLIGPVLTTLEQVRHGHMRGAWLPVRWLPLPRSLIAPG